MYKLNPKTYFQEFSKLVTDPSDDSIDRLSSGISVYILLTFCVLAYSSLYVGSPMECMFPSNTPQWDKYYSSYCFVQSKTITQFGSNMIAHIPYYPWVPYFLAVQAILFYLPKFFWDGMKSRTGIDIKTILKEAKIISKATDNKQKKKITEIAIYIIANLRFLYENSSFRWYSLLGFSYVIKKWLYVVVAIFQFYVMAAFIGNYDYFWGFSSLNDVLVQNPRHVSTVFPRLTVCFVDYFEDNTRVTKNHALPCVMGMNVIFEKMYVILYFWTFFVLIASICSATYATLIVLSPAFSQSVIFDILKGSGVTCKEKEVSSFIRDILHVDGLLVIKLIHKGYGPAMSEIITRALWDQAQVYYKKDDPILVNMNKYEAFDPNAKEISLNNSSIPLLDNSLYKNVSYC